MGISRSEGYRRGVWKEEAGLTAAEHFFEQVIGLPVQRIRDRTENYERGDFEVLATGRSIECKRQPIDPGRFRQNFVEVCEITSNPRHAGGLQLLSEVLGVEELTLGQVQWQLARSAGRGYLRDEACLSVSIKTMTAASVTVYVNPGPPVAHLYAYDSSDLLAHIKRSMGEHGLVRGAGRSNEDTLAVFVPLPPHRWTATVQRSIEWAYAGDGIEEVAVAHLRGLLGV